ncbi:ABC transporter substrate-binding protein [Limobrevibacterium gyesilva]|uniref:Transporter substrate-binding domain-containing protein n=1 Tax=Limobrevibacterium gyesilva TaxID=2991712 RepID=A0AA41YQF2_9PROT|nr:transporter substrate-binding domain-containing protein [Limobrevibacterium gyesilva]MCW3474580.1 transporter substrate-binding domain-containing protein [Limobrevibacterium gyesilva]
MTRYDKAAWRFPGAIATVVLLAVALAGGPAQAQARKSMMDQVLDRKELRVGVELKYPPIMYRDASGNPQGFEVELARTMCKTLNVTCNFVDVEFPALIPALQSGKIDIIVAQMALTPARAMVVDFCKPFEATGDVVIVSPKSPLAETTTAKDVVDALNKPDVKIAVQLSTVESQLRSAVFAKTTPVDVSGPLDAFLQVISGRADATLSDDVSALKYAQEHPGSIKVLLDGRHQPYLRNFPSGGGVLRGNGDFCRWVDVQVQDWINSGAYQAAYLKEVGWPPPLAELQLLRGGY